MARGINKVILIGNLGNDPEVRSTPNGSPVTNITLATSTSWRDKQTGELQERTEWHRIAFFNRVAEIVGEHLHKGSKIYVEGSLRTRKWQDKTTGADRYTTEIIANEMQMLDSRATSTSSSNTNTAAPPNQKDVKTEADGNVTPTKDLQFPNDDVSPNRAAWKKEKNRIAEKVSGNKKKDAAPFIDDEIPF